MILKLLLLTNMLLGLLFFVGHLRDRISNRDRLHGGSFWLRRDRRRNLNCVIELIYYTFNILPGVFVGRKIGCTKFEALVSWVDHLVPFSDIELLLRLFRRH